MGKNRVDYVGLEFLSEKYGRYVVVACDTSKKITIRFQRTGFEYTTTIQQVRKGCVRDKKQHIDLVFGNGVFDVYEKRNSTTKQEGLWRDMLARCYSVKKLHHSSSYSLCGVSEEFLSYTYFEKWCNEQFGFNLDGYQLDKDILSDDGNLYSENNCCFIPSSLNTAFVSVKKWIKGGINHTIVNGKYHVRVSHKGVSKHLGCFESKEEADDVYSNYKKCVLKNLAAEYEGRVDVKVINRLLFLSEGV